MDVPSTAAGKVIVDRRQEGHESLAGNGDRDRRGRGRGSPRAANGRPTMRRRRRLRRRPHLPRRRRVGRSGACRGNSSEHPAMRRPLPTAPAISSSSARDRAATRRPSAPPIWDSRSRSSSAGRSRRRVPERRLHSLQGPVACGQGDRGCGRHGRLRHRVWAAENRSRRLRGWKNKVVSKLTNGPQRARKQRKVERAARRSEVHWPAIPWNCASGEGARRVRFQAMHHRRRVRVRALAGIRPMIRASSIRPARWSCPRMASGCW